MLKNIVRLEREISVADFLEYKDIARILEECDG